MIDYVQEEEQEETQNTLPEEELTEGEDSAEDSAEEEDSEGSDAAPEEDGEDSPPVDALTDEERAFVVLAKSGRFSIVDKQTAQPEQPEEVHGPKLVEVPDVLDDPEGFAKAVQQNALVQAQHAMLTMSRGSIEERVVQAIEAKAAKLGMELSDTAKAAIRRDARSATPEQLHSLAESPDLHAGIAEKYVDAYPAPKPKKVKGVSVQPAASPAARSTTSSNISLTKKQRDDWDYFCRTFGYNKNDKAKLKEFLRDGGY